MNQEFLNHLLPLLVSSSPFIELRGGIPLALALGISPWEAFLMCTLANILPVPLILFLLKKLRNFISRLWIIGDLFLKIEKRVEKRKKVVEKYGYLGLTVFVSIPLPGSGAWTGSLLAFLLDLEFKKSFIAIVCGVLVAGVLITLSSIGVLNILTFLGK